MDAEERRPRGYEFGQRRPPLSVLIKNILERYPDGQIFKEIIQNADDAKARTVRFYLDHRHHGKQSLVHEELKEHQGPALIAYNDAQFEDSDWESIQNLQMSSKAKDPFKVGKFGIGFNSVYHISDIPIIVSRDRMAFLDPQERMWEGKSGKYFRLADVKNMADTVSPFSKICDLTVEPFCHGTIFRFPLRRVGSNLSNQCYNMDKIQHLLEALKEEGKFLLLFLRSIETIEVHEIIDDATVSMKFSVCISQGTERVRKIRDSFLLQIKEMYEKSKYNIRECISMSIDFHINLNTAGVETKHHWLVVTHVGSENASVLHQAAEQCVFPWVGVALELSNLQQLGNGRTFCFLPMPPDVLSPFPIHINATFGLNDDRRTIRWHGVERTNDPAAQWNSLIVSSLLPSCYKRLITDCIAVHNLSYSDVYKCWPNLACVDDSSWKGFMQPFLNLLFKDRVVWATKLQNTGEWIRLVEATVIQRTTQLAPLIHNVLTNCDFKIVYAPKHVHALIKSQATVNYLTCSKAKAAMKQFPASYIALSHAEKLELLKYCLSDGEYRDLAGLQLVPLADNTFTPFYSSSRIAISIQKVYICSKDFPKALFRNMDKLLVSLDDHNLLASVQKVGNSNFTQLKSLDFDTAVQLIKQNSLPPAEWQATNISEVCASDHQQWYKTFWEWVKPHSLSHFANSLVVPLSKSGPLGGLLVTRLSNKSPMIYLDDGDPWSPEMMSFVSKMPVHVAQTSTHPFFKHKELHAYVNKPTPEGLLSALVSGCKPKYEQLTCISVAENEAQYACQFFSRIRSQLLPEQISVLKNLPIFTCVNQSGLYSITKARYCSWNNEALLLQNSDISDANLPQNIVFLSPSLHQSHLLEKLQPSIQTLPFILNTLFVMVTKNAFCPTTKLNDIMVQVLTLLPSWKTKWPKEVVKVISALQSLPFLPTGVGPKSPSQLYDPRQTELVALFEGEKVFPLAPFDSAETLVPLQQCGLMTKVTCEVLVGVVSSICAPYANTITPLRVTQIQYNRAKAVVNSLQKLPSADVAKFFQQVATLIWIPVLSTPPSMPENTGDDYPQCLPWKGRSYECHFVPMGRHVFVPGSLNSEYPLILGSQVYIADCVLQFNTSDKAMLSYVPPISSYVPQVLSHFKEVITHSDEWEPTEKILHLIYNFLSANCSPLVVNTIKTFPPWIWLASAKKFVSPSVVAVKPNPSFQQDLSPYIYTLSDRFNSKLLPLFEQCGVAPQVVSRQIASVLRLMSEMGTGMTTSDRAWQLVMSILNWLTENGEKQVKEFEDVKLYIPIESDSEYPTLKEVADNIVYSDNEFLEGVLAHSGQEYSYILVNHRIHPQMARSLGLAALSKHLDISEETFDDVGQCEPLTVRLRNILRDYKDGLTIIKEMIQNADDADATEINICYDTRTHCQDQKSLFFPQMAEAHGPALLIHNNAVFTDDDFQNITKLAGATKENKPLKIGKFGIGFCSVYHMTDVPSFVSREFLYIFDPTLHYLGDAVKNRSKPGKKLSFSHQILRHSKQMDPFHSLFDFNPSQKYNGTIFRLPFRKNASEISSTVYDNQMVMELLHNLEKQSNEMILFLHNIKHIRFSRFDDGCEHPTILAEIKKQRTSALPNTGAAMYNITRTVNADTACSTWLIATQEQSTPKYATSSVACSMKQSDGKYRVCSCEGESFCFLPLNKTTGLPVHVNSNFAVNNNRRGIWTDEGSQGNPPLEAQWNVQLMTSTIPKAYCLLLETLKEMHQKGQLIEYIFHALLPVSEKLQEKNPWTRAVDSLYKAVASKELFYSSAISKWLPLGQSKVLSNNILSTSVSELKTDDCVLNVIAQLRLPIVDLPLCYHSHLDLSKSMITETEFVKIFFDSVKSLTDIKDARNSVLLKMLQLYTIEQQTKRHYDIAHFLKKYPCIPCSPDGTVLKCCQELIDPDSTFAKMYDKHEHMYPIGEFYENALAKGSMIALGLLINFVPWKFIIERANSVQSYYSSDQKKALRRANYILQSISLNISSSPEGVSEESKSLATIPFLPVKSKPKDYPLHWCGEGYYTGCGKDLVLPGPDVKQSSVRRNELLCGSQVKILQLKTENEMPSDSVVDLLQLKREPLCKDVVAHFKHVMHLTKESLQIQIVQHMCRSIYGYFELLLKDPKVGVPAELEGLKNSDCILVKDHFVNSRYVSEEWSLDGPYLFKIPEILTTRKSFSKFVGVQESFSPEIVFEVLQQMKKNFNNGEPVTIECQHVISKMLPILSENVQNRPACNVVLPDTEYVLRDSCVLVYNDTPWCPVDENVIFIHENVPRRLAEKLGVKTVRSQRAERYASTSEDHFSGTEFGQHEELTQRIQNIIRDYPFDETVIKELLQNADDAKAKKVYIMLDKRTHQAERVLSKEWKELQGPALLVWNDSVFSENDLKGIQNLGLGSKRSDAEKIGQYGIGFNAVYHLTDCPSFISNGETLCILDPHCRYAPGASPLKPGRRFDRLSTGFWDDFQDMKTAYLHADIQHFPEPMQNNLKGGSLFRFPIRHSEQLVSISNIIPKHDERAHSSKPLSAKQLENYLKDWSPCVRKSMLFLNNINAITICTIEENGICTILHDFETKMSDRGELECAKLREKVHGFKSVTGSTPCTISYELELLEKAKEGTTNEAWLIQQGIGDIMNESQQWEYIHQVKPRHGVAFRLGCTTNYESNVFCFLPLPIQSHLPVLINGHFILDSNRRELWKSTNPDCPDPKSIWNKNLISAIASSYANLLIDGGKSIVSQCNGRARGDIENNLLTYYRIFPDLCSDQLKGCWKELAEEVYRKLGVCNANVLATVRVEPNHSLNVKWCKLTESVKKSEQVHFFDLGLKSASYPNSEPTPEVWACLEWTVFEAIGMILTSAPLRIMNHFKHVEYVIPVTTPDTVFDYYKEFRAHVLTDGHQFPCSVEYTSFKTTGNLKSFLKYLLIEKDGGVDFVKSPFGVPLLLTADGNITLYSPNDKVVISKHFALFQKSLHKFLHPDLFDLEIKTDYFIHGKACSYDDIESILISALPKEMLSECYVKNFQEIINQADLKSYWECFSSDPVFLFCLPEITQRWALLPSSNNELFSSKSPLLPIVDDSNHSSTDDHCKDVVSVLKAMNLPFLPSWTCTLYHKARNLTCCPRVTSPSEIILCLQIFHEKVGLSLSTDGTRHLECLLKYLSRINFKNEKLSTKALKSLPLFQTIDNTLVCINNMSTFLFPTNICLSGHNIWFVKNDTIFLDRNGLWTRHLSPSDIDIKEIRSEEIFCKYIFPKFHLLSEDDRYEQLKHIRNITFKECKLKMETQTDNTVSAENFLRALKSLPCLGEGNGPLKCISEFYDHTLEIFELFKDSFCFVPERYKDKNEWLQFFVENGLQQSIKTDQFLILCHKVANGNNDHVYRASRCLLSYLCQKTKHYFGEQWHIWQDRQFLGKVSSIPFVCMDTLHELSWIKAVCPPVKQIHIPASKKTYLMVVLNGAVLNEECNAYLIWTIRPLVSLSQCNSNVIQLLGIKTEIQLDEIIRHITCIAEGHLSNALHFDRISEDSKPPPKAKSLIDVMTAIFQCVRTKYFPSGKDQLLSLHSVPCIPVYRRFGDAANEGHAICILVKPCQVVANSDAKEFYPFLHELPIGLYCHLELLQSVGVKKEIDVSHLRIVLEMAYKASNNQPLDVNTRKTVTAAIECLHKALKERKEVNQDCIKPLYLPDNQFRLWESTSMVYRDDLQYKDTGLDFADTDLTEVFIPPSSGNYRNINDTQKFLSLLPITVRPKCLSSCVTIEISSEPVEVQCSQVNQLQRALNMQRLPKAVLAVVKHVTGDEEVAKNCYECLCSNASKVEIRTVQRLHYDIKVTSSNKVLGRMHAKYAFDAKNFRLYIEPSITPVLFDIAVNTLSHWLLNQIEMNSGKADTDFKMLSTFLPILLKLSNEEHVDEALYQIYKLELDSDPTEFSSAEPRLGEPVPRECHHRLDQDIHNIFTYQEWVGYEKEEGKIIFAQVIHCVTLDCDDPYRIKYVIRTSQDDLSGTEVSALDLYKFLKGNKILNIELSESQEIVVRQPNEDGGPSNTATGTETPPNLHDILTQICSDLTRLWQLPEEDRRRAVKRLYLKWHPDKNLHQVDLANQVFKFLKRQVERLEKGQPIEDPTTQNTSEDAGPTPSTQWQQHYKRWDDTSYYHRRTWNYERSYRKRNRHHGSDGGGWSGGGWSGGGWGGGFWYQPTQHQVPDRAEGQRWFHQAEADMEVLQVLFTAANATPSVRSYVCFMAYEVICKALKAGLYFKCGLSSQDRGQRSVVVLASTLETEAPSLRAALCTHANVVKGYEESTRFPHLCQGDTIPARHFDYSQAEEARKSADMVLNAVRRLMEL